MAELSTDNASQVVATCKAAVGEVAEPEAPQAVVAGQGAGADRDPQVSADEKDARVAPDAGAAPTPATSPRAAAAAVGDPIAQLPVYVRSLLRIRVPVQVRLASKRQSIGQIVDLCPGSIITFAKTCDEMLELKVGGCDIAQGEAVKVGDKFGLRISSITLPNERFQPVTPRG